MGFAVIGRKGTLGTTKIMIKGSMELIKEALNFFDFGSKIIPTLTCILAKNSIMHARDLPCLARVTSGFFCPSGTQRSQLSIENSFFLAKTKNRTFFEKCRSKGHRIEE